MDLEQFCVFQIDSPLTSAKRRALDAQLNENDELFEREVSYRWLRRGEKSSSVFSSIP